MRIILCCLLIFWKSLAAQTLIRNVNVVDVEAQKIIPAQDVFMSDGIITAIGRNLNLNSSTHTIDGTGKWLMPGLVDAHVHFGQSGGVYARPDAIDLRKYVPYEKEMHWQHTNMESLLRRYLSAGITSVVDVGSSINFLKQRDSFKTKTYAPEIFMTGPLITTWLPPVYTNLGDDVMFYLMKSADEGRALVRKQLLARPDFIKIWYIVNGKNTDSSAKASLPMVRAVIEEAHQQGLRVAVHATEQITAKLAVGAGADYLVHGIENEAVDNELIALLKKNKTVLSPTLVVAGNYWRALGQYYKPSAEDLAYAHPTPLNTMFDLAYLSDTALPNRYKRNVQRNRQALINEDSLRMLNLRRMADAGVIIATGTDAGNVGTQHISSYYDELRAMQQAGMSNWQLLEASTLNGAKAMNAGTKFGNVRKGMKADLLLLNSNPVGSIDAWKDIDQVIKNGMPVMPAALLKPGPEELADQQLVAYNAHNLEAFLKPYADTVKVFDLNTGELLADGKQAMRKMYGFLNTTDVLHCRLVNRIVEGEFVIDHEEITLGDKKFSGIAIYQIQNGEIVKVWFPPV